MTDRAQKALLDTGELLCCRYSIGEMLGAGGMAQVFRARDLRLSRDVAVKIVDPRAARIDHVRERFLREARAMAAVESAFLVRIYDVDEEDGRLFLVQEVLEGRPLARVLEDGRLEPARAVGMVCDVLCGLEALHGANLIHRDVKPSNVFILSGGRAVLLDLGIVYEIEGTPLTSKGVILGTPEYMSPEHAQGQPIDFRTDLYAAALIAIFAITGDSGGIDSTSAVHRRVAGDQWMEPLLLEVPESLRGVLVRALARAPERRYGSAASMRADLLRHVPRRARSAEKDVQQRAATQMPRRSGPPTEDMRAGRSSQSDDE